MLRENSSVKCKKPVRNRRKLRIRWPYLTGRDKLVRFRGLKSRKGLNRSVRCLKNNGNSKRKGKRKLNSRNSCSIVREISNSLITTPPKSN